MHETAGRMSVGFVGEIRAVPGHPVFDRSAADGAALGARSSGSSWPPSRARSAPCLAAGVVALLACVLAGPGGRAGAGEPTRPNIRNRRFILTKGSGVGERMNVVDESLYALAELYMAEDRVDDAIAIIERVAKESPHETARSISRYNLGRIYDEKLKDPARARAEYARVTGRMAAHARMRVLAPLRREKRWDEAIAFLKECVAAARKPEDKAGAVRELATTARSSRDGKLIEAILLSVPDLISYEDAKVAAEARRKMDEERRAQMERSRRLQPGAPSAATRGRPTFTRPPTPFGRREMPAPVGRMPGMRPPAKAHRAPGARAGMPMRPTEDPGHKAARPDVSRQKIEAQIRELERAGFPEEARRLRKKLEEKGGGPQPEQF